MPTDLPPDYKPQPKPAKPGEGKPLPVPPAGGEDVKGYPQPGGKDGVPAPDVAPTGVPAPADMPTF